MKLTKLIIATLLVVAFIGTKSMVAAQGAAKDGKTLFVDGKCNNCHGVKTQGIEQTKKNDKYPDLSDVGDKVKADFLIKYLNKEEKMNDKNHPVKFKGEATELETLSTWLAGLKAGK